MKLIKLSLFSLAGLTVMCGVASAQWPPISVKYCYPVWHPGCPIDPPVALKAPVLETQIDTRPTVKNCYPPTGQWHQGCPIDVQSKPKPKAEAKPVETSQ